MAASVTVTKERDLGGGVKLIVGTIAMDSSYPTGGETLDLSSYFPGNSVHMFTADVNSGQGYHLEHSGGNATSGTIMAFVEDNSTYASDSVHAQAANTTSLATLSAVRFVALGE